VVGLANQEIIVREAVFADSPALLKLQMACVQGRNLKLVAQNSPDFFSRSLPCPNNKIYVALYNGEIVGSAACAVDTARCQGQLQAVGYGFQFLTAPEYRGRGIARLLNHAIEEYLLSQDVSFYYMLISKDNHTSQKAMGKLGFKPFGGNIATILLVRQPVSPAPNNIRQATPADFQNIARLLNSTWASYDLYQPVTSATLAEFVSRTSFNLNDLLVLEEAGELIACAAIWRWRDVTRQQVYSVSLPLKLIGLVLGLAGKIYPLPHLPKPGAYLRQWCLVYPGFTSVEHYHKLLYLVNNQAFAEGIEQIFVADNASLAGLKGLWRTEAGVEVHFKYLKPFNTTLNAKPIYVSMLDL